MKECPFKVKEKRYYTEKGKLIREWKGQKPRYIYLCDIRSKDCIGESNCPIFKGGMK